MYLYVCIGFEEKIVYNSLLDNAPNYSWVNYPKEKDLPSQGLIKITNFLSV